METIFSKPSENVRVYDCGYIQVILNNMSLTFRIDTSYASPYKVNEILQHVIIQLELYLNRRIDSKRFKDFVDSRIRSTKNQVFPSDIVAFHIHIQEFINRNTTSIEYTSSPKPEFKTEDFTKKEKQILLLL
jgi:hypothetical protein